jgi:hypothetical protein
MRRDSKSKLESMQRDSLVNEEESNNQHVTAGAQESPKVAKPHIIEGPKCFLMMKTSETAKVRIKVRVTADCRIFTTCRP